MGRLLARIAAAGAIAALLLWASRAHGALALDVRRAAHRILAESVLPTAGRTPSRLPAVQVRRGSFAWPTYGVVTAAGDGIAIAAPGGTLVRAAAAGTVRTVRAADPGVAVAVQSGPVILTYAHLGPSYVRTGERVRSGEAIGEITHFPPGGRPVLRLTARENGRSQRVLDLLGAP